MNGDSVTISNGERWSLAKHNRELLLRIRSTVHDLAPLAASGNSLIALGEVWEAIDAIINNAPIVTSVTLMIGFRHADEEQCEEGLFMCLRIDEDGLVLDELNTTYCPESGSDHYTVDHGRQSGQQALDEIEANRKR